MTDKLFSDSDAGIPHLEFIHAVSAAAHHRILPNREYNRSPRLRIFDRVAQEIEKDLCDPGLIAVDLRIRDLFEVDMESQFLARHLGQHDTTDLFCELAQIAPFLIDRDPPALDPAHVQDVVDKAQQMVA